jgi:hypothetical protein
MRRNERERPQLRKSLEQVDLNLQRAVAAWAVTMLTLLKI